MQKKFAKYFWFLMYLHVKMLLEIVSLKKRILIIGSQWVNKKS